MVTFRKCSPKSGFRAPGTRNIFLILFLFFPVLLIMASSRCSAATNYSTWSYYRSITIVPSGLTGAVGNFPLLVRLTSSDTTVFSQSLSNGYDVRFTNSDGTSDLSFQRVSYNQSGDAAEFWVLVPSVAAGTTVLQMYWGNSGAGDVSSGSAVFSTNNNFQGVWHMQAASGSNDTDATSNALVAQPANSPKDVAGVCGTAKLFNGTSQSYTIQNSASGPIAFPSGGPYTISFWVNFNSTSATQHVLTKASGTGPFTGQYFIALTTAGFRFGEVISGATQKRDYPTSYITIGQWMHVACIRRDLGITDTNIRLYVGGVLVGTASAGAATGTYEKTLNVTFGKDANISNGNYFNGSLDEIQMSNVDRGDDWVNLSHQSQQPDQTIVTFGACQKNIASVLPNGGKARATVSFSAKPGAIVYSLTQPRAVEISFCDVLGRIAMVINRIQQAGYYTIAFKDLGLTAGRYTILFKTPEMEKTAVVVLIR